MSGRLWNRGVATFFFYLLLSFPAFGAENRPPQWYEIAAGIISIPAGLIGLAYSYILIKKTRLEARKTELEIAEKERQIHDLIGQHPQAPFTYPVRVLAGGSLASILLLRFAILYLLVTAWGLVEDVWGILFGGLIAGAESIFHMNMSGWAVVPVIVINKLPKIVFWILFGAMALPLFRDINSALGLDVHSLFRVRWRSEGNRLETEEGG